MAKKKKEIIENEVKEKKVTLFDIISYLTDKKKSWEELNDEERKVFNPYMVNKFLSMDLYLIEALNELQKYTLNSMDKKDVYSLFYHLLPKQKLYLKYIKSQIDLPENEMILLEKHFKVSKRELEDYYIILNNTEDGKEFIQTLKENYAYEKSK